MSSADGSVHSHQCLLVSWGRAAMPRGVLGLYYGIQHIKCKRLGMRSLKIHECSRSFRVFEILYFILHCLVALYFNCVMISKILFIFTHKQLTRDQRFQIHTFTKIH